MGYRLSKITTRTGDDGFTSVVPKQRLPKNHALIDALGVIDELNSAIGWVMAHPRFPRKIRPFLLNVQQDLFDLGGELCPPHRPSITTHHVKKLDEAITDWNAKLPPLKEFILPGGNLFSASCHLTRAICRRAERILITLHLQKKINPAVLQYINRLSDVLFVLARVLNLKNKEILWAHERKKR